MAEAQLNTPVATDTVSMIQGILDRESAPAAPTPQPQPQEPAPQEPSQPATEEAPAEPVVEGDDAPPAAVAEIPLDQLEAIQLEVEVSGDEGKVTEKPTIKELKAGYMRQKDYSKKTAEVARQREEIEGKVRQGVESERTAYLQNLQQLKAAVVEAVAPELRAVNWNDLSVNNPAEYVRLKNRAEQIQQTLQGLDSKQQEILNKQKSEQSQKLKDLAVKARTTLEQDIPGWNDGLYQKLMESSKTYGYTPEEVGSWVDSRAIKLLHDAYQYRELKATPPDAKKVVNVPKVIKPGATPAVRRTDDAAMKNLQKSGRVEDAAAVIRARMR